MRTWLRGLVGNLVGGVREVAVEVGLRLLDVGLGRAELDPDDLEAEDEDDFDHYAEITSRIDRERRTMRKPLVDAAGNLVFQIDVPAFGTLGQLHVLKIDVPYHVTIVPRDLKVLLSPSGAVLEAVADAGGATRPSVQVVGLGSTGFAHLIPQALVLGNDDVVAVRGPSILPQGVVVELDVRMFGFIPDDVLLEIPAEDRKVVASFSLGVDVVHDVAFGPGSDSGHQYRFQRPGADVG